MTVSDPDLFSVTVSSTPPHSFIALSGTTFTFNPLTTDTLGSYPITVTLFDGAMTATSTFNVIISALPPVFITIPLLDQYITVGASSITYTIVGADPASLPITLIV